MKRIVIRERTPIPPFGEPARDLRILNKPLWLLQRDLLAHHCRGALEVDSLAEIPSEREELLVYRDNLFFNDQLINTFIEQAKASGHACQIAFALDDKAITTHALRLQDGITLDIQHNVYIADLYYYPSGVTEEPQPLVVPTDPREMGYYHIPTYMAPNHGDLVFQVPRRAFLSIENWVHLFLANSPFGVFSWGRIHEQLAEESWKEKLAVSFTTLFDKLNPFAPRWRNHFLSSSRLVKVGKNCSIDPTATIHGPTIIGDNVTIGAGVVITNSLIGKNVTIMQGSQVMLSVVSDRCYLPWNAGIFMTTLMENSMVAQLSCLQMCVVGRNTFIGAGNIFTDFDLRNQPIHTYHQRKGASRPEKEEVGLPVIGSAVGHNCKIGSGFVVYPARMIGSNSTLIYADTEAVVGRNVRPMTNIDDLEVDDQGEPLRTVYKWPRVIERPDALSDEEPIAPLHVSWPEAARLRH
ncbi:DapH/DapD/GlmU-related protein [Kouleothrix sp.]|uniref:DapH/DapD/GlmU-related protein n=1 Tax=Kouleothrix sp. TaxID=2779161 RepID=UPI00391CCDA8